MDLEVRTSLSSFADTSDGIAPDTSDSALIDALDLVWTRSRASARYCGVACRMYSAPNTQNVPVIAVNKRLCRIMLRHRSRSPSLLLGSAVNDDCPIYEPMSDPCNKR